MHHKIAQLKALYENEVFHSRVYARLAKMEKNGGLKGILQKLTKMEEKHMRMWGAVLKMNDIEPVPHVSELMVDFVVLLSMVLGVALTVKLIEYFEERLHVGLKATINNKAELSPGELKLIRTIDRDTETNERKLEDAVLSYGKIIGNIRDVIFGMNDGLVEILGVVVGLAAAIGNPIIVLLGGIIVAVSGTLSMGGGAYLSTEYEEKLEGAGGKKNTGAPMRSALYVGVMYLFGSLFPLAPFALGFSGINGIVLAIIVTTIVLTVVSVLIAVLSGTSMLGRISKTLLISLGIDAITIIIGLWARAALNLPPSL